MEPDGNSPPRLYRLTPIADKHREESCRMILSAAAEVPNGRAIVLGAGKCAEIPLIELALRFKTLMLNDIRPDLVRQAIDCCVLSPELRERIEIDDEDLTGLTEPVAAELARELALPTSPENAIGRMAQVLSRTPSNKSLEVVSYDLVVASCLLTQLHTAAAGHGQRLFAGRFPDQEKELTESDVWKDAVYALARRMEADFMDRLTRLVAPGGRIFLSETVQVCFVQGTEQGDWSTAGTFRMTRTRDLADYLDARFRIEARGGWTWVISPPTKPGETGRAFDVQGLVLSLNAGTKV